MKSLLLLLVMLSFRAVQGQEVINYLNRSSYEEGQYHEEKIRGRPIRILNGYKLLLRQGVDSQPADIVNDNNGFKMRGDLFDWAGIGTYQIPKFQWVQIAPTIPPSDVVVQYGVLKNTRKLEIGYRKSSDLLSGVFRIDLRDQSDFDAALYMARTFLLGSANPPKQIIEVEATTEVPQAKLSANLNEATDRLSSFLTASEKPADTIVRDKDSTVISTDTRAFQVHLMDDEGTFDKSTTKLIGPNPEGYWIRLRVHAEKPASTGGNEDFSPYWSGFSTWHPLSSGEVIECEFRLGWKFVPKFGIEIFQVFGPSEL